MKTETPPVGRQTKYVNVVLAALENRRHATNLELLEDIHAVYPEVSATTIHRVTARLHTRGIIGRAPKSLNGAERYDVKSDYHHHFTCQECDRICDIPQTAQAAHIIQQIQQLTTQCVFASTLTIIGVCQWCASQKQENNT